MGLTVSSSEHRRHLVVSSAGGNWHCFVAFPSQFAMSEDWSFCSPSHEGHVAFVALCNMFFLKRNECAVVFYFAMIF